MPDDSSDDDAIIKKARKDFQACQDAEDDNRRTALEDIEFARAGKQWPDDIRTTREREGRPCLTINKLPTFIRQVVNDARQNKPSIKVHPADSKADPETAEVINGLIRNIEYTSNADVAYDTATECAVSGGFGYIRIGLDYAFDDSFEMDITINRVNNPFSVYGDPYSTAADSSDWNLAFVVDRMSEEAFEAEYGDAMKVDWDDASWNDAGETWRSGKEVMVAEYWTREKVEKTVVLMSDGSTLDKEDLASEDVQLKIETGMLSVVRERVVQSHKVMQRIMTGVEVLKTTEWPGRYIPIVPVYGDEFDVEGKRYFRSLIYSAKDAQRQVNYWRSTSTELVALAPKVPWIGPVGSFDTDQDRWNTANTKSHAYLEYDDKGMPPQRIPLDSGVAAGALQEALNASDDMKSIIGLYDASLGARSNETSGKAIQARQREGDVSTFHFIDNMARAIRHAGRVIIDLIPKVYDGPRIVRVMGEDGTDKRQAVNQPGPVLDKKGNEVTGPDGVPMVAIRDLTAGKYDLTVTTGPSFTTRRQEAAQEMVEMIRAVPDMAATVMPQLVKNLDWPGADDLADEIEKQKEGKLPPEAQKAMEDMKQQIAKLTEENQKLKTDQSVDMAKVQSQDQLGKTKLSNEYQLGLAKIRAEQNLQAMQSVPDAVETQDMEGQPIVKQGSEAVMEGLGMLGQLVAQQGQAHMQALGQIARIVAAPNELVRDPVTGKAAGSRKVLQ